MGNTNSNVTDDDLSVKMNEAQYADYVKYLKTKNTVKSKVQKPKPTQPKYKPQVLNVNQQKNDYTGINKNKKDTNIRLNTHIFSNPGLHKQFMPIVGESTSYKFQNTKDNNDKYKQEIYKREYNKTNFSDGYLPRMRSEMSESDPRDKFEQKLDNLNNTRNYTTRQVPVKQKYNQQYHQQQQQQYHQLQPHHDPLFYLSA